MRTSVVLPAPLGPSSATTDASGTTRFTPWSAFVSPKARVTPSTSTIAFMLTSCPSSRADVVRQSWRPDTAGREYSGVHLTKQGEDPATGAAAYAACRAATCRWGRSSHGRAWPSPVSAALSWSRSTGSCLADAGPGRGAAGDLHRAGAGRRGARGRRRHRRRAARVSSPAPRGTPAGCGRRCAATCTVPAHASVAPS